MEIRRLIDDYLKVVDDNKAGKNICFVSRGEWSDPEIAYMGLLVDQVDVEDYLDDKDKDEPGSDDWRMAMEGMFEDYRLLGLMKGLDEFKISDVVNVNRIIDL